VSRSTVVDSDTYVNKYSEGLVPAHVFTFGMKQAKRKSVAKHVFGTVLLALGVLSIMFMAFN